MARERLTADQAADRLGVKPATVYAYVSRGFLTRTLAPDGRRSLFDAAEIDTLARRGRPRRSSRPYVFEIEIETALTEITEHRLRYRGHDAIALAGSSSVEQVAALLWTGVLPPTATAHGEPWPVVPIAWSGRGEAVDRIRIAVATAAAHAPDRTTLARPAVIGAAHTIVSTAVSALAPDDGRRVPRLTLAGSPPLRQTIAGRVWAALAPGRARPEFVGVMNAALVLLLDHELAASTFAARVAASTRADPYAVVAAGLGPLSGPLHGGASRGVRAVFDTAAGPAGAAAAVDDALRTHGHLPGYGHRLYPDGDPRAAALLTSLRAAAGDTRAMATVEAVLAAAGRRVPVAPNVDAALGAFGHVTAMPTDSGEAIFAIARSVGWIAHALEEYEAAPLRFRPRARYVGSDRRPPDGAGSHPAVGRPIT